MLMHGRLFLTAHGIMLDEVKSLLQKSLRRKEEGLVLSSCRELLGFGKDQLQWKSLVTFLFEDHCLVESKVLQQLVRLYEAKDKYGWVELLLKCHTCRVAACLPVIAMEDKYLPVTSALQQVSPDLTVSGLLSFQLGDINIDLVLTLLINAWKHKVEDELIFYMKLMTICHDHEKRTVTTKGMAYLVGNTNKANIGHIVMSVLWKSTPSDDKEMKSYLTSCFKLASVKEASVRLILYAPVTYLLFRDQVKPVPDVSTGHKKWSQAPQLSSMPGWAVDKHTYRGKTGNPTSHLLKNINLNPEAVEEFHGSRPKKDIESFFNEGTLIVQPAMEVNPYWERTKAIYLDQTKQLQKTVHMTKVYIENLKNTCPALFCGSKGKETSGTKRTHEPDISDTASQPKQRKTQRNLSTIATDEKADKGPIKDKESNKEPVKVKESVKKPVKGKESNKEPVKGKKSDKKPVKGKESDKKLIEGKESNIGDVKVKEEPDLDLDSEANIGDVKVKEEPNLDLDSEANIGDVKVKEEPNLDLDSEANIGDVKVKEEPDLDLDLEWSQIKSEEMAEITLGECTTMTNFSTKTEPNEDEPQTLMAGVGERSNPMRHAGSSNQSGTLSETTGACQAESSVKTEHVDGAYQSVDLSLIPNWPLLQLPTGYNKVHTRLDMANKLVWKGPFRFPEKMNQVLFKYKVMKEFIGDRCTLAVEVRPPYLVFPLAYDPTITWPPRIIAKNYKDAILKQDIDNGQFVDREDLGVIQLHHVKPQTLKALSPDIWVHFLYRYALNIGDSGLYNAITDKRCSFLYGIDLDDERGKPAKENLIDFMFVKHPNKLLVSAIMSVLKDNKIYLIRAMNKSINYAGIDKLVAHYSLKATAFRKKEFIKRVVRIRTILAQL